MNEINIPYSKEQAQILLAILHGILHNGMAKIFIEERIELAKLYNKLVQELKL